MLAGEIFVACIHAVAMSELLTAVLHLIPRLDVPIWSFLL